MIVQYQKYVMILDLISFIDYIFILMGKERKVNFDHSITIHNSGISLKLIRPFYIELEMVLFLSSYPSYYFLRDPGWIWDLNIFIILVSK